MNSSFAYAVGCIWEYIHSGPIAKPFNWICCSVHYLQPLFMPAFFTIFPFLQKDLLGMQKLLNSSETSLHQLTAMLDCRGLHKVSRKENYVVLECKPLAEDWFFSYPLIPGLSRCLDWDLLWWRGRPAVPHPVFSAGCHGLLHHHLCHATCLEAFSQQVRCCMVCMGQALVEKTVASFGGWLLHSWAHKMKNWLWFPFLISMLACLLLLSLIMEQYHQNYGLIFFFCLDQNHIKDSEEKHPKYHIMRFLHWGCLAECEA